MRNGNSLQSTENSPDRSGHGSHVSRVFSLGRRLIWTSPNTLPKKRKTETISENSDQIENLKNGHHKNNSGN
jgi:hypothetical protein